MTQAEQFLNNLKRLNRQDRSHLAAFALANPTYGLGEQFRTALGKALGVEVPEDAVVATDYQFSWLYAAAILATYEGRGPFPSGGGIEAGFQEEMSLLVAWASEEQADVVIVEAQGVSGWSTKRMLSRAHWLGDIFGYEAASPKFPWITPHAVVVAPTAPPIDLITLEWPEWMVDGEGRPAWVKLPVPSNLQKVTRSTPDGMPRAPGGFWFVEHG